jgi:hypothetical protein
MTGSSSQGIKTVLHPVSPRRIQAWREVNELPDRELLRDGRWLV